MKRTPFGDMLNSYKTARDNALRLARSTILKRHPDYSGSSLDYKLVQDKIRKNDGTESISVALWKKVDEVVISIAADIKVETQELRDRKEVTGADS